MKRSLKIFLQTFFGTKAKSVSSQHSADPFFFMYIF